MHEEQDKLEVILAFLWASEQGLLSAVTLSDMKESPHLNQARADSPENSQDRYPSSWDVFGPSRGFGSGYTKLNVFYATDMMYQD